MKITVSAWWSWSGGVMEKSGMRMDLSGLNEMMKERENKMIEKREGGDGESRILGRNRRSWNETDNYGNLEWKEKRKSWENGKVVGKNDIFKESDILLIMEWEIAFTIQFGCDSIDDMIYYWLETKSTKNKNYSTIIMNSPFPLLFASIVI